VFIKKDNKNIPANVLCANTPKTFKQSLYATKTIVIAVCKCLEIYFHLALRGFAHKACVGVDVAFT